MHPLTEAKEKEQALSNEQEKQSCENKHKSE
jgi:hypothetical protein